MPHMIHPKFWLKHRKARRAAADYPLYDVPHKQAERTLSEDQVQENFSYFMRVRLDRLALFQCWLNRNFGVTPTLNGDGILALYGWCNDYGGGLIGDETYTASIFDSYQPLWRDQYAGYNVMVDIAIFLGEYLISKRPRLHWEIYRGHLNEEGKLSGNNLARPIIGGFPQPRQWKHDGFQDGYGAIAGSRQRARIGNVHRPGALINRLKTTLHLAGIPDGDYPFTFGDYRDEPL